MRILDRYIFKSVLNVFLTCLAVFLALYIIIDILSRLEDILKLKVSWDILVNFYLSYLPTIIVQVSPFAGLLSTLYTFGTLNRDNEIIAMRASGLSVLQITKTVIIFGTISSLIVFWMTDKIVPKALLANQKYKVQMEINLNKPKDEIHTLTNLSMYGLGNRLFFVTKFLPATSTMEGITILEHDHNQNITQKIVANKGIFKNGVWIFYQCITYDFDPNGQMRKEPQYEEEAVMAIPESPRDFLNQKQSPDLMTITQLDDYIWRLSKSGAIGITKNLKVDFYQRFTAPLTNIVIILLGIPFAFLMRKRATGMSALGLSIFVGFLYYVLTAVSIALGKSGTIAPILAASLSHIAAFSTSLYLISKLP